jgi:hypothetical protein
MPRLINLLKLLVLLAVVLPGAALASATTGTVKGVTVDEGGLPIPAVLITLTSDNLMGQRQTETDANGRFYAAELPPGKYTMVVEKAGFTKKTYPNLEVNMGRNTILTVELPLQTGGEEMVIEESRPTIDTESANRGSVLTKEFLDRIPSGQSYQSAAQLAAGVTGGSNPNMAGAGSRENTYMLDGVEITDPVTGTFSINFNQDALEQLEVLVTAFDPEYNSNMGGRISLTTRSGGNTMEVNTGVYYTNGNWAPKQDARYAADGALLAPTDFDTRRESYRAAATVSGPIIRDRVWFITSYQYSRSLISNVGIDLPRDFDGHYVFTKLTVQPTAEHRFTIIGQADPSSIDNMSQSNRFVQPEAQTRQAQGGYLTSLQWDWFISPEMFFETKTLLQKSYIEISSVPCTHDGDLGYNPCETTEHENTIDFSTPARIGRYNAFSRGNAPGFLYDDRWRASIDSKFSLLQVEFGGTHDFKAGVNYSHTAWNQSTGYAGNMYFFDANNVTYDPDTLTNWYWIETTGPYSFSAKADYLGLFIQDAYKPIDNLTFRFGTRYDKSILRNNLGDKIVDVGLWGPRFSVLWDPWSNGKTKIQGSVGRFNASGRLEVANFMSKDSEGFKLNLGELYGEFEGPSTNNYFTQTPEDNRSLAKNVTAPYSDEFTVGAEREILQDLAATLFFSGKFVRNLWAYDDTNRIWDEDGFNILGTRTGGSNEAHLRLRSPNIAQRNYFRTDVGLQRAMADRWAVQANYSLTYSRGSVQEQPSGFLAVSPQVKYMIDRNLFTDVRHDVTAAASWDVPNDPWTTNLGLVFFYESGNPISRFYDGGYIEGNSMLKQTAGTYAREESSWQLNFRVEQAIPVRTGNFNAIAEVYNIFNNRQGDSAYVNGQNRWIIAGRQNPVELMLGAEYEF